MEEMQSLDNLLETKSPNLIKGKSRDEDINREAESESNKRRRWAPREREMMSASLDYL